MTPRRAALLAAVTAGLLGFGAQAVLWATGEWTVGRGLYDYRAATWGDVVVVPGLCGLLTAAFFDRRVPPLSGERRWTLAGGMTLAVAGALVQASWLAASDPVLNWTLPAAHRFSFPGWYHAGFVVIVCGFLGATGVTVARRLRAVPAPVRDQVAREPATATFVAFGVSFGGLLALDSADSLDTAAGQGSAAGAGAGAVTTIALLAAVLGARRSLRPAAQGLAGAAVVLALATATHGWPS